MKLFVTIRYFAAAGEQQGQQGQRPPPRDGQPGPGHVAGFDRAEQADLDEPRGHGGRPRAAARRAGRPARRRQTER